MKLRFRGDTFRILELSDIQERADFDRRTAESIDYLLDTQRPDLVMLGGDNCFGPDIRTKEELTRFLDRLASFMEKRATPWAHIFGNHDHDVRCVSAAELQAMYEAYPHCISRHSEGMHGVTNYYLDILDAQDAPAFRIWCLDTNGALADSALNARFGAGGLRAAAVLPVMPGNVDRYDIVYFDQLVWYDAASRALEADAGRLIPSMMFCHIAPEELSLAIANPKHCALRGGATERLAPAALNSGLFSLLVQRGDVGTLACAHTHKDSFQARYCGIQVCFDACAGYTCYGLAQERGGRVFDIDRRTGRVDTRMVFTAEHVAKAGRDDAQAIATANAAIESESALLAGL